MRKSSRSATVPGYLNGYGVPLPGYQSINRNIDRKAVNKMNEKNRTGLPESAAAGGTFADAWKNGKEPGTGPEDFRKLVGFEIVERRMGYAKGELAVKPCHLNVLGVIHGGVLFTIADTTSGAAASTGRPYAVPTVNGSINYLKAGKNTEKIIAEAEEIKNGRNFSVCVCKIYDDKGELLATTTMTFFHLMPPEAVHIDI